MNKYVIIATLIMVAVFCQALPLLAQGPPTGFIHNRNLQLGATFKTWKFDTPGIERYTELAFPVVYRSRVRERLSLEIITSPFLSKAKSTVGDDIDFNNITDTLIRSSYLIGNNLALLTVGVGLPTGQTELNQEEVLLSGLAANRPLNYPVANFGTGLSVHFGLAIAQQIGSWVVGIGGGYSLRNEYDAVLNNQTFQIDPGDEINLSIGIDRELSDGDAKISADFIYTNYTEDDFTDETAQPQTFESGDKFVIRGQYLFPVGVFDPVILTAMYRWRLDNRTTNAALINNSNQLYFRAALFQPLGNSFSFEYVLDADFYSNTVGDSEGATILGIGGGFIVRLSRQFSFDPTVVFHTGSINTGPDSQLDITGIEVTGGLAFIF